MTVVHKHTHEQFLQLTVGLGLVFVCFWFSLDYFVFVFASVVLGLVSSVLYQDIGWKEYI